MSSDWQEFRESSKNYRLKKQEDNKEIVLFLSGELEFKVEQVQEYHLRLFHSDGRKLDYFPQKGRSTWLGSNKWFIVHDIEQFIYDHFKDAP